RGVAYPLVAIDEGMILDQREGQGHRLLQNGRVEFLPAERHVRLCDGRLQAPEVAYSFPTAGLLKGQAGQFEYLLDGQVAHQASLRYSSAFFARTYRAAWRKSSPGCRSQSCSLARARPSGDTPARWASSRSCCICSSESGMVIMVSAYLRGSARVFVPAPVDQRAREGRRTPRRKQRTTRGPGPPTRPSRLSHP